MFEAPDGHEAFREFALRVAGSAFIRELIGQRGFAHVLGGDGLVRKA